jgi:uncharacterized protein (DUF2141 family)
MSMVTAQNAKADLGASIESPPPVAGIPGPNGDAKNALIFQDGRGKIFSWLLDGSGNAVNFGTGSGLKPGSRQISNYSLGDWKVVAFGDLNGDGVADVIFRDGAGRIFTWFLDGSGDAVDFASGRGLKPGSKQISNYNLGDWKLAAVGDLNGDGFSDILFQDSATRIFAWFLDGSGNAVDFASGSGLKPGSKQISNYNLGNWKLVAVSDLSGDGIPDIVFQDTAGRIFAWFLDGSGNAVDFASGSGLKPGSKQISGYSLGDWKVAAVRDVSGDGTADIVFQNGGGQIFSWFLDGSGNAIDWAAQGGLKPGSKHLSDYMLGDWKLH